MHNRNSVCSIKNIEGEVVCLQVTRNVKTGLLFLPPAHRFLPFALAGHHVFSVSALCLDFHYDAP